MRRQHPLAYACACTCIGSATPRIEPPRNGRVQDELRRQQCGRCVVLTPLRAGHDRLRNTCTSLPIPTSEIGGRHLRRFGIRVSSPLSLNFDFRTSRPLFCGLFHVARPCGGDEARSRARAHDQPTSASTRYGWRNIARQQKTPAHLSRGV